MGSYVRLRATSWRLCDIKAFVPQHGLNIAAVTRPPSRGSRQSTGFFPAIYLPADAGHGWPSSAALKRYVTSIVDEATRARGNAGSAHDTPLLVYVWPKYLNGSTFLSAEDLEMSFSIPHSGCADGMVVWGDRVNAADAAFWSYTKAAIGPVLERIRSSVRPQCRGGVAA